MKLRKFLFLQIKVFSILKQVLCFLTGAATLSFGIKFLDTILFSFALVERPIEDILVEGQVRTLRPKATDSFSSGQNLPKRILLWTTYFGRRYSKDFYFFEEGSKTFKKYKCPYSHCEVTANKSALLTADAILFHAMDMTSEKLPKHTRANQIKILYNLEAPGNVKRLKWRQLRGYFNWTMTYRSDSSIQVQYGLYLRHLRDTSSEKVMERSVDLLKTKSKRAAWFVSSCDTESRREHYVKELQKYYPVDIYGLCGRFNCTPSQSLQCYQQVLKHYAFYLSFENSICKDYVTEKFYNALNYDIVPVVFGGANYEDIAPPNSYIDAMKYSSPKDLAMHLRKVEKDPVLYSSFLRWKSMFEVHMHPWMCDLCHRLMAFNGYYEIVQNAWDKVIGDSECKRWTKNFGFRNVSVLRQGSEH